MKSYIPTINISSLLKSEFESKSAINTLKKIEKACFEVGFFQVAGHGISFKKIENISLTHTEIKPETFSLKNKFQ